MANKTIGQLTLATSALDADLIEFEIAASGLSRRITKANFIGATLTGGGTIATGGFTLTVPATGTASLLGTAQTYSALKTFSAGITVSATSTLHRLIYASETVTIASGAAAISKSKVLVNGEGGLADDLGTISGSGLTDGQVVILSRGGAVTITVKHNSGNIFLDGAADFALNNQRDTLMLIYNATAGDWCEIGRGNNA